MTAAAIKGAEARARRASFGPWLWSARADLLLFGGTALVSFALVALGHATGLSRRSFPEWGWVAFILCIDVAHVYSTVYRTYFDGQELREHKLRYFGLPLALYVAGVALHWMGSLVFWRVLAYAALFHFIRQQVGWVAVYRARSGVTRVDKLVDDGAVYAATLYPVLYWHTHLGATRFAWFVRGDFVDLSRVAGWLLPYAHWAWLAALTAFVVRQVWRWITSGRFELGKCVVVASTFAIWYVGIVATNSDFDFTVTNVIVHGVPYIALLWFYARERRKDVPESFGSQIAAAGVGAFVAMLLLIAFVEETAWDRWVWHDHAWLFGASSVTLGRVALALVVPLLALPQATHYVLDGVLWRRGETRRLAAQRRALGFEA